MKFYESHTSVLNMFENREMLTGVPVPSRGVTPMGDMREDIETVKQNQRFLRLTILASVMSCSNVFQIPVFILSYGPEAYYIYMMLTVLLNYPIMVLEIILGQYYSAGPGQVFKFCPLLEGISISMALFSLYYPIFLSLSSIYGLFYFFTCIQSNLPWERCPKTNISFSNIQMYCSASTSNETHIPSSYYWFSHFDKNYNEMSASMGFSDAWMLAVNVLIIWTVTFLILMRGKKSAFHYLRISIPLSVITLMLLLFMFVGIETNPKVYQDIFQFNWNNFFNIDVWIKSVQFATISTSASSGQFIFYGSNSYFRDQRVYRDAKCFLIISMIYTSSMYLLIGIPYFSILNTFDKEVIRTDLNNGSYLYIIFPYIFSKWAHSHLWCILFFFAIVILGINSLIAPLETFRNILFNWEQYFKIHKTTWTAAICFVCMLTTMIVNDKDSFRVVRDIVRDVTGISLVHLSLFEILSIHIYGRSEFIVDTEFMLDKPPNLFCRFSWMYLVGIDAFICVCSWYYKISAPQSEGKYETYLLMALILLPIPIRALQNVVKYWNKRDLAGVLYPEPGVGPKYEIWKAMRDSFIGYQEQRKLDKEELRRRQGRPNLKRKRKSILCFWK